MQYLNCDRKKKYIDIKQNSFGESINFTALSGQCTIMETHISISFNAAPQTNTSQLHESFNSR